MTQEPTTIPAGYKQTSLGILPEAWEVKGLGQTAVKPIVYGIVQAGEHDESGMPYIKSSDVGGEIDIDNLSKAALSIAEKYKRSTVQPGDIVFSLRGNIGELSIVPVRLKTANLTQGTARISVTPESTAYTKYALSSPALKKIISFKSKGSTFQEISLGELRRLPIALPPLPEQRAIANVLSTWDTAITKETALIEALKRRHRALMQRLLSGTVRLPGFEDGWEEVRLGEIATIQKGEQLNGEFLTKTGLYPAINGGINPSGYTDKWNTEANTITISEGGNSCGFVSFIKENFWSGGHCYTLQKLSSAVNCGYLFHALKNDELSIMALRVGSGLPNIQIKPLQKFELSIPSLPEQTAIASLLSASEQEIKLHKQQLAHLQEQKKGLMQILLIGKVRVKNLKSND